MISQKRLCIDTLMKIILPSQKKVNNFEIYLFGGMCKNPQYLAVIDLDNLISILKASGHIVTDTDQGGGTGEKTESES